MCMIEHSREIYRHLADEQSRMIYMNRMNYSLTGDKRFIEDLVDRTLRRNQRWQSFCGALREKSRRQRAGLIRGGDLGKYPVSGD